MKGFNRLNRRHGEFEPNMAPSELKARRLQQEAADKAFEAALNEYDSDEIGALDYEGEGGDEENFEEYDLEEGDADDADDADEDADEDGEEAPQLKPTTTAAAAAAAAAANPHGMPKQPVYDVLMGDSYVESLMDEFLTEKKDDIFMKGVDRRVSGGGGYAALVKGRMISVRGGELESALANLTVDEEDAFRTDAKEELEEADEILARGKMRPPEEDVLIDGKSYFDDGVVNPWDCESILSTYSNLDNNPAVIGFGGRRLGKKKNRLGGGGSGLRPVEEQEPVFEKIKLSEKTGLPLGVLEGPERQERGGGENKGVGRKQGETAEEKRIRKQAVKEERTFRREEKKDSRRVVAEEVMKRSGTSGGVVGDVSAGASVFKYS